LHRQAENLLDTGAAKTTAVSPKRWRAETGAQERRRLGLLVYVLVVLVYVIIRKIEPASRWIHFEGLETLWCDAPASIEFSCPVWIAAPGHRVETGLVSRLNMVPAVRYQVSSLPPGARQNGKTNSIP